MKLVVFGLSISSSWGNGHATLLRGLFRALKDQGHEIHFFERDTPYYSAHRDAVSLPFAQLHLYAEWEDIIHRAKLELQDADAGMVTSYCPDSISACDLVLNASLFRTVFYDMDTPVTLSRLERGEGVPYIGAEGLRGFDLVLSYTGGVALKQLRDKLSARRVAALYGWVDREAYYRVEACDRFESDLSYMGTYSPDRQAALKELLITPAEYLKDRTFAIAGAMYPASEVWPQNIRHFDHVAPPEHRVFYSSSPLTLNITRASMAAMGYCPSGRLFEAAACGTAVLSDWWPGLDIFFEPGEEILIAASGNDSISALHKDKCSLRKVGARAKERTLTCHTAEIRASELIKLIETPREIEESREESRVTRGA